MKSLTLINVLQITIACLFVIWSVLLIYSYGTEHREILETRAESRKLKSLDQRVQLPPDNFVDETTLSQPETERETTVINDDVDSSEVITGNPTEVIPPEVTEEFDSRERGDGDTTTAAVRQPETEPEIDNEISPPSSSTSTSTEEPSEPSEPEVPLPTEPSGPDFSITESPIDEASSSETPEVSSSEAPEVSSSETPETIPETSSEESIPEVPPTETSNESSGMTEETAQPAPPGEESSVSEETPTEPFNPPEENESPTSPNPTEEELPVSPSETDIPSPPAEPETEAPPSPPVEESSTSSPVATETPPTQPETEAPPSPIETEAPPTPVETEAPPTQPETEAPPTPVETEPPVQPETEPPQVTEEIPEVPITEAPETVSEVSSPSPPEGDNQEFMTERVTYTPETSTDSPNQTEPTTELNYINPEEVKPEVKQPPKTPTKTYAPSYNGWFYRYVPAKMGGGGTQSYWYRADGVGLNRIDVTPERRPTAMDIQGALDRELQRRKSIQHWLLQSLYQYSNTMANEIITVSKLMQTNRFEMDQSVTSSTMTELQRLNRMLLFTNEYLQKLARFQEYDGLLSSA